ncbi:MAG: hypothetical protein RLZ47_314 [Bacteroidota bacterium]|jgi:hypothetical protein
MNYFQTFKYILLIWLIFNLISSCQTGGDIVFNNDRSIIKRIFGEEIKNIEPAIIKKIGLIDTAVLIIKENDGSNPNVLNVYSLKNYKKLSAVGEYGISNLEFKSPKYDNQYYIKQGETYCKILDANNYDIREYKLRDLLEGKLILTNRIMLPSELVLRYNSIWLTSDSTLIGDYRSILTSKPYRFFIYNLKNNSADWLEFYPEIEFDFKSNKNSQVYTSFCSFSESYGRMGSAMHYIKRVDFMNFDGSGKTESVFEDSSYDSLKHKFNILSDRKSKIFYTASFAGKKYFYATCAGTTLENYIKNKGNMQLHLFDWGGRLKKVYQLDQMNLGHFLIDEKTSTMLIVKFDSSKQKHIVLKYKLI